MEELQVLQTLPRVHWETLPDDDWRQDIQNHEQINKNRSAHLHDSLLNDLWSIVLSFLFNKNTDIIVSIPLRELVTRVRAHLWRLKKYPDIYYGFEDKGEFAMMFSGTDDTTITVDGHFPFHVLAYSIVSDVQIVCSDSDLNRRFLMRMIYNSKTRNMLVRYERKRSRYTHQIFIVWHKTHSRFLHTEEEVEDFIEEQTNDEIPVIQSKNGILSIYHAPEYD